MNQEEREKKLNALVNEKYSSLSNQEKLEIAQKKKKESLAAYIISIVLIAAFFILPFIILSIVETTSQYITVIVIALIIEIVLIFALLKNKKKDNEHFCKLSIKQELYAKLNEEEKKSPYNTIEYDLNQKGFYVSKQLNVNNNFLFIDGINKKFMILKETYIWSKLKNRKYSKIYDYSNLIKYEIFENGSQVVSGTSGRSLIGGALFGLSGAIIGSSGKRTINDICNELKLVLYINDIDNSFVSIAFLAGGWKKNTNIYKASVLKLQEWCSILELMLNDNSNN